MKNVTVVFLAVISLWIISMLVIQFGPFFSTPEERGQFGDSFGSINALFAGLAFAGVIYAILLQREELSLQRNELELTRKELERSANAQEESRLILDDQLARQKQTAQLSAYTTLLNWEQNSVPGSVEGESRSKRRQEKFLGRIEDLLLDLET